MGVEKRGYQPCYLLKKTWPLKSPTYRFGRDVSGFPFAVWPGPAHYQARPGPEHLLEGDLQLQIGVIATILGTSPIGIAPVCVGHMTHQTLGKAVGS